MNFYLKENLMTQSYPSSAAGALSGPITNVPLLPIQAKRAPTVRDINYAIGQQWVYVAGNEIFFLSSVVGNTANWVQLEGGGGGGAFNITGPTGTITTTAGPLTINSGTGTLGISTDAAATTVNVGTGAGVKTVTLGSTTGASNTSINAGTAGVEIGTDAVAMPIVIGNATGATGVSVSTGTNGFTVATGTGNVSISNDPAATIVNVGTGNGLKSVTLGSVNTASSTDIYAGTGGIVVAAAGGTVSVTSSTSTLGIGSVNTQTGTITIGSNVGNPAVNINSGTSQISIGTDAAQTGPIYIGGTGSGGATIIGGGAAATVASVNSIGNIFGASATVIYGGTLAGGGYIALQNGGSVQVAAKIPAAGATPIINNANVGQCIFTGLTTAAGAQDTVVITNSLCTAASVILATASNTGNGLVGIVKVLPGTGTFSVIIQNFSTGAAVTGNVAINYWLLQA